MGTRQIKRLLLGAVASAAALVMASPAWAAASWQVVPTPNVANSDFDQLNGTYVASSTSAWAVGFSRIAGTTGFATLIEHWNGTAWTIVPGAAVGSTTSTDTRLDAASGTGPGDVWAVGSSSITGHSLIEHFDGTAWSTAASPASEPTGATLVAVSADSPTDVWADGYYNNTGSAFVPLLEHFDGTNWSVVTGAFTGAGSNNNRLLGVAAVSPGDVWAIGVTGRHPGAVFEHFNGTAWSEVPQPVSGLDTLLPGITALSSNDVWAVGTSGLNTVAEHWDGTAWTQVTTPNPPEVLGGLNNELTGVTALSPTDVWATGISNGGVGSTTPAFTEHWDGTQWSLVPTPLGSSYAQLLAISGRPGGPLVAAGFQNTTAGLERTLVLQQ